MFGTDLFLLLNATYLSTDGKAVRTSFHSLLWSKESGCAGRLQNKHLFIIQTN